MADNNFNDVFDLSRYKMQTFVDTGGNQDAEDKGTIVKRKIIFYLDCRGKTISTCPSCGQKMYHHSPTHVTVVTIPAFETPARLRITVPRMRCRNCGYLWRMPLDDVLPDHLLTKNAYIDIVQRGLSNPLKAIGTDYGLSTSTIKSFIESFWNENTDRLRFKTPTFLGIGKVSVQRIGNVCVLFDLEHHSLFDIVKGEELRDYFRKLDDSDTILWILTEPDDGYLAVIPEALPKAKWGVGMHCLKRMVDSAYNRLYKAVVKRYGRRNHYVTSLKHLADEDRDISMPSDIEWCRRNAPYDAIANGCDLWKNMTEAISGKHHIEGNKLSEWESMIPQNDDFDGFRDAFSIMKSMQEQIKTADGFPPPVSDYFDSLIRCLEKNGVYGHGNSFALLRSRSLYGRSNITALLKQDERATGPQTSVDGPLLFFE